MLPAMNKDYKYLRILEQEHLKGETICIWTVNYECIEIKTYVLPNSSLRELAAFCALSSDFAKLEIISIIMYRIFK